MAHAASSSAAGRPARLLMAAVALLAAATSASAWGGYRDGYDHHYYQTVSESVSEKGNEQSNSWFSLSSLSHLPAALSKLLPPVFTTYILLIHVYLACSTLLLILWSLGVSHTHIIVCLETHVAAAKATLLLLKGRTFKFTAGQANSVFRAARRSFAAIHKKIHSTTEEAKMKGLCEQVTEMKAEMGSRMTEMLLLLQAVKREIVAGNQAGLAAADGGGERVEGPSNGSAVLSLEQSRDQQCDVSSQFTETGEKLAGSSRWPGVEEGVLVIEQEGMVVERGGLDAPERDELSPSLGRLVNEVAEAFHREEEREKRKERAGDSHTPDVGSWDRNGVEEKVFRRSGAARPEGGRCVVGGRADGGRMDGGWADVDRYGDEALRARVEERRSGEQDVRMKTSELFPEQSSIREPREELPVPRGAMGTRVLVCACKSEMRSLWDELDGFKCHVDEGFGEVNGRVHQLQGDLKLMQQQVHGLEGRVEKEPDAAALESTHNEAAAAAYESTHEEPVGAAAVIESTHKEDAAAVAAALESTQKDAAAVAIEPTHKEDAAAIAHLSRPVMGVGNSLSGSGDSQQQVDSLVERLGNTEAVLVQVEAEIKMLWQAFHAVGL